MKLLFLSTIVVMIITALCGELNNARLPSLSLSNKFLKELCREEIYGMFPGSIVRLPYLKSGFGFNAINATTTEPPTTGDPDYDGNYYGNTKFVILATYDLRHYPSLDVSKPPKQFEETLKKWVKPASYSYKFLGFQIYKKPILTDRRLMQVNITCYASDIVTDAKDVLTSPFYSRFWDPVINSQIGEGVCYSDQKVPVVLRDSLRRNLDLLTAKTRVDYHPNSNGIVRDLVHPSLYPYVDGVSQLKSGTSKPARNSTDRDRDFWGRSFENSTYQWLPTLFKIDKNGKCSIDEYINNLDRNKFQGLYNDLEQLFEVFLPYFEDVWSYGKAMKFWNLDAQKWPDSNKVDLGKKKATSFRGQELQVMTKIVEYKLNAKQTYEGVWHVEGMSHENIVMTGIYFIDRDKGMKGGDLKFKRGLHVQERHQIFFNVMQSRAFMVDDFASKGIMPLGKFQTDEGYILVFPNCHIHKISKLINAAATKTVRRRIIVFFVVNPEQRILSTSEIAPQQNTISWNDALNYRLKMMEERKYQKNKFNTRDIELCEH